MEKLNKKNYEDQISSLEVPSFFWIKVLEKEFYFDALFFKTSVVRQTRKVA